MISPPFLIALALLISLILYLVLGGADFGGGILVFFARAEKKIAQRDLIRQAIAPIWEANHVWLILLVVLLFTAFPSVFAYLSILLHVPLSLMLLGIIVRGSAFAFQQYDPNRARSPRWETLFALASVITPFFLGLILGAITEGNLPAPGVYRLQDFFLPWLSGFCLCVGIFTVLLCSFLAAVFLTAEAKDAALAASFAQTSLLLEGATVLLGALVLAQSEFSFFTTALGILLLVVTTLFAGATAYCLKKGRYLACRLFAPLTCGGIVTGWGLAQLPFLVKPHFLLVDSAASNTVLLWLSYSLGMGAVILTPSLIFLFRIFKS